MGPLYVLVCTGGGKGDGGVGAATLREAAERALQPEQQRLETNQSSHTISNPTSLPLPPSPQPPLVPILWHFSVPAAC
jgi:hypothetical protein